MTSMSGYLVSPLALALLGVVVVMIFGWHFADRLIANVRAWRALKRDEQHERARLKLHR